MRRAWAALLLGVALGCGSGDDAGGASQGPPPVTVEVMTVETTRLRDWLDLVGQLESEASVIVKPEISGIIDTIAHAASVSIAANMAGFAMAAGGEMGKRVEA